MSSIFRVLPGCLDETRSVNASGFLSRGVNVFGFNVVLVNDNFCHAPGHEMWNARGVRGQPLTSPSARRRGRHDTGLGCERNVLVAVNVDRVRVSGMLGRNSKRQSFWFRESRRQSTPVDSIPFSSTRTLALLPTRRMQAQQHAAGIHAQQMWCGRL